MTREAEQELIRRACLGDGDAMAELVSAHQDGLYAFMLRMSGRPHIAEDIVQEAFVRVLRNIERFDTRFRFSTWVFTIAKRLYVNAMQKHRPVYDTDTVSASRGRATTPGRQTARTETMDNMRGVLDNALGCLNEQQREIILLFHQQNWPITDIAVYLDMPEGTVKSHLHRARKRMKKHIEGDAVMQARVAEVWN
ncbi:MAG: RNA polymerase sigma factor [Phycisphaerales bacterium]